MLGLVSGPLHCDLTCNDVTQGYSSRFLSIEISEHFKHPSSLKYPFKSTQIRLIVVVNENARVITEWTRAILSLKLLFTVLLQSNC